MRTRRFKIVAGVLVTVAVIAIIAAILTMNWLRKLPPKEAMKDIKAAIAARNSPRQVERYLEERYGPLTDPANRERAFLDFFNVEHVKALHFLVNRMPAERRATNITAMADWIGKYRETMTPAEKEDLRAQLNSPEGMAQVRQATAAYLSQDVHYRAANAMVIAELMTTLTSLQEK